MKKSLFNICNLYVLMWFLMYIKGLVYTEDILSVIFYIVAVAISGYCAFECFTSKNNPPFVKAYNVLFALLCIYGIIRLLFGSNSYTYNHIPLDFYLQKVIKSMLPFYAFYSFAKKGYINKRWLQRFAIVFLVTVIFQYFENERNLLLNADVALGGVTNNMGYSFIAFLPFVCLFSKRKIFQYFLLGLCVMFIILSMKRGAALTMVICVFYFFTGSVVHVGRRKWQTILLTAALCFLGYYFIMELMDTNDYFMRRVNDIERGNTSNRNFLFAYYWDMFWHHSNALEYFIGRGADGTINTGNNYAHNDWIEILINQGFLGITIYLVYWIQFVLLWLKNKNGMIKVMIGIAFLSLFVRTFFSMSINEMSIIMTCMLGVVVPASNDENFALCLTQE